MKTIEFNDINVSATIQITAPVDPTQAYYYVSLIIDGSETGELGGTCHNGEEAIRYAAERFAKDESTGVAVAFVSDVRDNVVAVATMHKFATFA